MAKPKTWREKLNRAGDLPKVEQIPENMTRWGAGTLVVPAPIEVDGLMRKVPEGQFTTINAIRTELARLHGADIACPITTGIFSCIAARAAEETREVDPGAVVKPWWRTVKSDGSLNPKFPGGEEGHRWRLESEGVTVVKKRGTGYKVPDVGAAFVKFGE